MGLTRKLAAAKEESSREEDSGALNSSQGCPSPRCTQMRGARRSTSSQRLSGGGFTVWSKLSFRAEVSGYFGSFSNKNKVHPKAEAEAPEPKDRVSRKIEYDDNWNQVSGANLAPAGAEEEATSVFDPYGLMSSAARRCP